MEIYSFYQKILDLFSRSAISWYRRLLLGKGGLEENRNAEMSGRLKRFGRILLTILESHY